ncbi:MAG: SDR family NAD(P)-dependent oxidoreductase, partial [Nocardioides sp.]
AAAAIAGATTGPGSATVRRLDVTDAADVQAAVDEVVATHGRIDLLFNNAGITFGGETQDLTLDQWNAVIDVNIRGVVHGVAAAYPLMVAQRSGHIINTASMGGLVAAGLITSYVTSKHAVVGLSLALRTEAAAYGVGVLAVCPAAVETPILDQGYIGDFNGREFYLSGQGVKHALDADVLAAQVLTAVQDGRALLVTPRQARIAWRAFRYFPGFTGRMSRRFVDKMRTTG